MTFGERIMDARRRADLYQAELAEMIGRTEGFISLLETGRRLPTDAMLKTICEATKSNYQEMLFEKYLFNEAIHESVKELIREEMERF